MYRIKTINKISPLGLELFPRDKYEVASEIPRPHAILVRSADLHAMEFPCSLLAIARAGAGVNNIPLPVCSNNGVVVFNTPGGNANAVKELTLAALFLASRNILGGWHWSNSIANQADAVPNLVEKEKNRFEGPELHGKTLGIVGLGAIGVLVANSALALGMQVVGYDPFISIDAAWNLSRSVEREITLEGLLAKSDYITLHLPFNDDTRGLLNADKVRVMKTGARLVNLARGGIVNEADIIGALKQGKLSAYVTDFPTAELLNSQCPGIICIPHLGASTPEAEDNCAIMAVKQLMNFLEYGTIKNSVNFPQCDLAFRAPFRLLVINRNVPKMVGQITMVLAQAAINITDLINHHRGDYAYNIIDTDHQVPLEQLEKLIDIDGVIKVRVLERNAGIQREIG